MKKQHDCRVEEIIIETTNIHDFSWLLCMMQYYGWSYNRSTLTVIDCSRVLVLSIFTLTYCFEDTSNKKKPFHRHIIYFITTQLCNYIIQQKQRLITNN